MSREAHVQFCESVGAKLPRATHLVVLCRKGQGTEMHRRLKRWLENKGLKLNEKKTRIVDFEKENFEFLGFRLS